MGEKRFILEKYADDILVLAHKYVNENPDKKGTDTYFYMEKTLETMDKYWAYINLMGFMMYEESIMAMKNYLEYLIAEDKPVSKEYFTEIKNYLISVI